jgi:murein DD-endopeptidase MepM/ murein hydrolase activator NlpD
MRWSCSRFIRKLRHTRIPEKNWNQNRKLLCEPLECRVLLAAMQFEDEIVLDFLWPAGGNNSLTYEQHPQYRDSAVDPVANIDINQDVERNDLAGGTLDSGKFDEADGGAPAFAGHDGIAVVHALGTDEDKIYGHSVEIVAYDERGYVPQDPLANRLFSTFYGHLQETFVTTGDQINLGQLIGRIGGSGRGNLDEYLPHIHFEFQNSERDAVSVNASLQLPDDQGVADPVRFYKGMLQVAPAHQLSASTVLYGPEREDSDTRSSVVIAAVRPNQRLHVNMKGFDWNEDVSIRITDDSGSNAFPYRDVNGEIQEIVKTAAENDEDITEEESNHTDASDLSPLFENLGLYYVQALERNRDVGWGMETDSKGVSHGDDVPAGETRTVPFATWNQRVGWAQLDWASESAPALEKYPRGPDADAINLAVVVSPFAPPNGIEVVTRADRLNDMPWRILPDRTLVITGTDVSDSIALAFTDSGNYWTLSWNEELFGIDDGQFTSVYVDGGEGDDEISLQDLPTTIGASVFGRGGNDSIYGGAATDFLVGGTGDDFLVGGPGEDWIFGNEDDDTLVGHVTSEVAAAAVDHLFGESGVDQLYVDGNDDSSGGTGVGWQHPANRFDVTNDGQVVPLDVLAVVNEINSPEYCDANGRLPNQRPLHAFYYDSNGDGFCTPVGDVLPIINFLNDRSATAEGEWNESSNDFIRFAVIDVVVGRANPTSIEPFDATCNSLSERRATVIPIAMPTMDAIASGNELIARQRRRPDPLHIDEMHEANVPSWAFDPILAPLDLQPRNRNQCEQTNPGND